MSSPLPASAPPLSRRLVAVSILRSLGATLVLIGGYYALPLDSLSGIPLAVVLTVALLLLAAAMVFQVRATVGATQTQPGQPKGRPGQADARRPIPNPLEHADVRTLV